MAIHTCTRSTAPPHGPNPTHNLQPYLHQSSTDDELVEHEVIDRSSVIDRRTGPPAPFWQEPEARPGCQPASNDAAAVAAQNARAKAAKEAVL